VLNVGQFSMQIMRQSGSVFAANQQTTAFGAFNASQKSLLRNSLGNLLPLSRPKNSSLQNKPFAQKRSEKEKFVGFLYGSLSENEVAVNDHWDAQTILLRGINLLNFAQDRWKLDFGDDEKKTIALGLEFVEKAKKLKSHDQLLSGSIQTRKRIIRAAKPEIVPQPTSIDPKE